MGKRPALENVHDDCSILGLALTNHSRLTPDLLTLILLFCLFRQFIISLHAIDFFFSPDLTFVWVIRILPLPSLLPGSPGLVISLPFPFPLVLSLPALLSPLFHLSFLDDVTSSALFPPSRANSGRGRATKGHSRVRTEVVLKKPAYLLWVEFFDLCQQRILIGDFVVESTIMILGFEPDPYRKNKLTTPDQRHNISSLDFLFFFSNFLLVELAEYPPPTVQLVAVNRASLLPRHRPLAGLPDLFARRQALVSPASFLVVTSLPLSSIIPIEPLILYVLSQTPLSQTRSSFICGTVAGNAYPYASGIQKG